MPTDKGAKKPESPKQALARIAEETRKMIEQYPFLRVRSSAYRGR
jgi:hypothetical protein